MRRQARVPAWLDIVAIVSALDSRKAALSTWGKVAGELGVSTRVLSEIRSGDYDSAKHMAEVAEKLGVEGWLSATPVEGSVECYCRPSMAFLALKNRFAELGSPGGDLRSYAESLGIQGYERLKEGEASPWEMVLAERVVNTKFAWLKCIQGEDGEIVVYHAEASTADEKNETDEKNEVEDMAEDERMDRAEDEVEDMAEDEIPQVMPIVEESCGRRCGRCGPCEEDEGLSVTIYDRSALKLAVVDAGVRFEATLGEGISNAVIVPWETVPKLAEAFMEHRSFYGRIGEDGSIELMPKNYGMVVAVCSRMTVVLSFPSMVDAGRELARMWGCRQ